MHCAKALLRASIWDTSTWPDADVPTLGDIITCQHELGVEAEVVDCNVGANYTETMWESGGSWESLGRAESWCWWGGSVRRSISGPSSR